MIEHDDVDDVEGDDDSDEKDEPTGAYIFMATAKGRSRRHRWCSSVGLVLPVSSH